MSYYAYRSSKPSNSRRPRGSTVRRGGRKSQYIDPARFVKSATVVTQAEYIPKHTFEDFDIQPLLKANLLAKGFTVPTPIQDKTIPEVLTGRDVIGIANTGTGKTAAFAVPILNRLLNQSGSCALIVAPTRELAQQIEMDFRSIGRGSGLGGTVLIGGAPIGPQLRDLRTNPQIVIGTPGRIKDHVERRTLNLANFTLVVLDEVDRMLDMGFITDVRHILSQLPTKRQSLFFSATLDARVASLIESFAHEPVTISLKTGEASENVHQNIVRYSLAAEKIDKLHDILISGEVSKAIVFDETQRNVERLSRELMARGFQAEAIHGGKTQGQRQRALRRFKTNEVTVLVATDVAARGLDVADITHVINYSQPQSYEDYIHRIGRAGRAGKIGHALTFVTR